MIATPDERNRLMQRLRAETCVRRKSGGLRESGTDELDCEGGVFLGTPSPDPWDLSH